MPPLDAIFWVVAFWFVAALMVGSAVECIQLYRLNRTTRYKVWAVVKLAIPLGMMLRFAPGMGPRAIGDLMFLLALCMFSTKHPKLKPGEQPLPAHEWRVRRIPVSEQKAYSVGTVSKPLPRKES